MVLKKAYTTLLYGQKQTNFSLTQNMWKIDNCKFDKIFWHNLLQKTHFWDHI